MKILATSALALAFAFGGSAAAAMEPGAGKQAGKAALLHGLDIMIAHAQQPPGQQKRPVDPDMGDDNASPRAILTVCTSDTPAAERSAICERDPVSPQ